MPDPFQIQLPNLQPIHRDVQIEALPKPREPSVLAKLDGEARAKHAQVSQTLGNVLAERQVEPDSLISRDTLRELFGKTTFYAKLKDQSVHLLHKISDRLAPGATGSHFMEAKRLTDRYQEQIANGASPEEKIRTLQALKNELAAHLGDLSTEPAKSFIDLVDAEIRVLEIAQEKGQIDQIAGAKTLDHREGIRERQARISPKESPGLAGERHEVLQSEIEGFDPTTLRHVETGERGVPIWAKLDVYSRVESDFYLTRDSKPIESFLEEFSEPGFQDLDEGIRSSPPISTAGPLISRALSLGNEEELSEIVTQLSDRISGDVKRRGPEAEFAFATSDGEAFKQELLEHLQGQLGERDAPLLVDGKPTPQAKSLLDRIFNEAAAKLSNQQGREGELVIDGKTYRQDRVLGEGGFGRVDLYVAEDGSTLAVKKSNPQNGEDAFAPAAREARMHRAVQGEGHPNVVQLKGVLRLPGGELLIAMETAPRGNVAEVTARIDEAVQRGDISSDVARLMKLTLIQDMIQGMVHLQHERGMMHLDIKGQNFLVGEDGRAMLADFGTGELEVLSEFTTKDWMNGLLKFTPPEVVLGQERAKESGQEIQAEIDDLALQIRRAGREVGGRQQQVEQRVRAGEMTREEGDLEKNRLQEEGRAGVRPLYERLAQAKERLKQNQEENRYLVTEKADIWSMGQVVSAMLLGKIKFEDGSVVDIRKELSAFGKDMNSRVRERDFTTGTGDGVTTVDRLINRMMHPDPNERPSLTDVLKSGVFNEPELGSEAIRELIKAVTDHPPDSGRIRDLARDDSLSGFSRPGG